MVPKTLKLKQWHLKIKQKRTLFLEPFSKDTPVDELVEKLAKKLENSVLILFITKGEKR